MLTVVLSIEPSRDDSGGNTWGLAGKSAQSDLALKLQPVCPDRLWSSFVLLLSGYQGPFSGE
jgi:hypothetical protein